MSACRRIPGRKRSPPGSAELRAGPTTSVMKLSRAALMVASWSSCLEPNRACTLLLGRPAASASRPMDRIVLEEGSIPTDGGQVHVDCSAAGLRLAPARPVFADGRITLQQIRTCQPTFNAAPVGYVEALLGRSSAEARR